MSKGVILDSVSFSCAYTNDYLSGFVFESKHPVESNELTKYYRVLNCPDYSFSKKSFSLIPLVIENEKITKECKLVHLLIEDHLDDLSVPFL